MAGPSSSATFGDISTLVLTPTPIPTYYRLSQYNRLKIGMTYAEAIKLMGKPTKSSTITSADGLRDGGYIWEYHKSVMKEMMNLPA
jgi:hypothetical protein